MLASIALLLVLPQGVEEKPPLTPEKELAQFTLAVGFTAELVASDPDLARVADLAFDDDGRLYAITALEYASGEGAIEPAGKGRDRVLVFDTPTAPGRQTPRTFAQDLAMPLALVPTAKGLLVAQGSEILRLQDADGDGVAERRQAMLTGFGVAHGELTTPRLLRGPGNWYYMAHGPASDSTIKTKSARTFALQGSAITRFQPDGRTFEVVGFGLHNIRGLVLDANGEMFVQDAQDPGFAVAPFFLGASYPGAPGAPRATPHAPLQAPLVDFDLGAPGFGGLASAQAASGFPAPWNDVFFVAHASEARIRTLGPRAESQGFQPREDLLASRDPWFRPIALQFGPDGCLYVADWYAAGFGGAGLDGEGEHGRIWRIRHESQAAREVPDLTSVAVGELTAHLSAPILWEARAAWHQIVDRKAVELTPDLESIARDTQQPTRVRVLAIWCLRDLARIDAEFANRLVRDTDLHVRRAMLAFYEDDSLPEMARVVMLQTLLNETDPGARKDVIRALAKLDEQRNYRVRFLVQLVAPPPAAGEVLEGSALERAFERSLIRAALEQHPTAVEQYLESRNARQIDGEQRAMCWLAIGGQSGAANLAPLLKELERTPTAGELRLLARHVADPAVAEVLLSYPEPAALALAGCDDDDAFGALLGLWPELPGSTRTLAIQELRRAPSNEARIQAALERGDLAPSDLE